MVDSCLTDGNLFSVSYVDDIKLSAHFFRFGSDNLAFINHQVIEQSLFFGQLDDGLDRTLYLDTVFP